MKNIINKICFILILIIMFVTTGCVSDQATYYLYTGDTILLSFDEDCTWSSTNDLIARVDENGIVTAVSMGETTILATSNNKDYKFNIVVKGALLENSINIKV